MSSSFWYTTHVSKTALKKFPIDRITKLANLPLSAEQQAAQEAGLNSVLTYMDNIKALDLQKVPLTARVTEEENVLREDEVQPSLMQAEALTNAAEVHQGFFKVKAVLENREA